MKKKEEEEGGRRLGIYVSSRTCRMLRRAHTSGQVRGEDKGRAGQHQR